MTDTNGVLLASYVNKSKDLEKQVNELQEKLREYENKFSTYTKEQAELLFKIQQVKQKLNNMHIKKSGKNSFQKYNYYELEDINKPICDALLEEGLASLFTFKDSKGYLQIVDKSTGAWIQWVTDMQTSPRWQKTLESSSKKGDVGEVMKAKQALQTYGRRTLYLQALEIAEPNTIEREGDVKDKSVLSDGEGVQNTFELPEDIDPILSDVFKVIKRDFKGKVPFNKKTVTNKLGSMKKSNKISEDTYNKCIEIVKAC